MKTMLAILAFAVLALGAAGRAAAQPWYSPYDTYDDYYDPPPPRIVVRPMRRPYFQDYSNFYPSVRGFGDRNPVPRGNMRGCTIDLGYGRYESCDKN
jgi:hypothetical protein